MTVKIPRIKTGDPNVDLKCAICWYCIRDYVHGTYEQYKTAKYFFESEEEEFDGLSSDVFFEVCGLDKKACYDRAKKLRYEKYKNSKEPAISYICNELLPNGKKCGAKFFTFEEYRKHLRTYKHIKKFCKKPGCHNLARIKYCSMECYWEHQRMKKKKRQPVIVRQPVVIEEFE